MYWESLKELLLLDYWMTMSSRIVQVLIHSQSMWKRRHLVVEHSVHRPVVVWSTFPRTNIVVYCWRWHRRSATLANTGQHCHDPSVGMGDVPKALKECGPRWVRSNIQRPSVTYQSCRLSVNDETKIEYAQLT